MKALQLIPVLNIMAEETSIQVTLDYIKRDISDIKQKLDSNYVTKDQFEPVKKIVYGLVTIILSAVVVALVALVIRK